jgi:hypothetical protein
MTVEATLSPTPNPVLQAKSQTEVKNKRASNFCDLYAIEFLSVVLVVLPGTRVTRSPRFRVMAHFHTFAAKKLYCRYCTSRCNVQPQHATALVLDPHLFS